MLFLSLIIASAAACTTEESPEAYLPAYYDLTLTLEEEVCGSDVQHPYWVQDGALHADSSVSTPGAVDLWLLAGDWGHTFNGVQVSEDGSFESWSLYAFVRDGEVIAPLFMVLEGSATQYGLDARLTEYYSDGSNNDWAVPDCRYVWQVQSR
ncbi:MAG TPA: hypothetical protein VL283_03860 [Candidatus Baltobacteraceae bacterium]|nr:hypothetical protein [Candidatus Baltobacteraceae bacterium]